MQDRDTTIHLSKVLKRGWIWIVSFAAALAVLGGIVGQVWPKTYTAHAILTVDETPDGQLSMQTEQLVASSSEVMSAAAEELGLPLGTLRQSVSVTVPRGALALQFRANGDNAEEVAHIANAVANAYRDRQVRNELEQRQAQIESLENRIIDLSARLADAPEDSAKAEAVLSQLTSAEEELLRLQLAMDETPAAHAQLVSPAVPPTSPSSPSWPVFAAAGLVMGVIAGSLVAVAARNPTRQQRHRTQDD